MWCGLVSCGVEPEPQAGGERTTSAATMSDDRSTILFLGDSLTAGYGVAPDEAFPALIQRWIDDAGLAYQVRNAGVSGETTTDGLARLDWVLRQRELDVLVLALGANDGLRGISAGVAERNLQAIIDRAREVHPDLRIVLTGMESPPNMGSAYTAAFRAIYPRLAEKNDVTLVPFLLEGVAGDANFNLPDGIHPNAEGHRRVGQNVWDELEPLLSP